jgi:demethylmenaquinone methyltransferase/2-methoxy-6-polyprenyl-1,4-benzoquinol methylase
VTPSPSSLDDAFVSPEAKRRYVRRLFATIAPRYDLITRLLSFGLDQRWKRRLISLASIQPGSVALDLACGTGDLAQRAAACGADVIGVDITPGMLVLARARPGPAASRVRYAAGDMTMLPLGSAVVDVITTGYGLRNVPDLPRALGEASRVLRPGGRLCSLDFNRPESAIVRAIYLGYLTAVGSALGWILHRDPDTYRYIPASIRRYPTARGVVDLMRAAGFREVRHTRVLGGLMAIHIATR